MTCILSNSLFIFISIAVFLTFGKRRIQSDRSADVPIPGNYPQVVSKGVNLPDCGLRYVPHLYDLYFHQKCFRTEFPNYTYADIGWARHMKPTGRVYKGTNAEFGESPWTALLTKKIIRVIAFGDCTGVLISLEWVMTNAHCYTHFYVDSTKIRVGGHQRFSNIENQIAHEWQWYKHPQYKDDDPYRYQYDLALIKLSKKFKHITQGINYRINPICLPTSDRFNWDREENATFFGWGLVHDESAWLNKEKLPLYLQRGEFRLSEMKRCPTPRVLCGTRSYPEADNPGLCMGDSGGGLVQYTDKRRNRAVLIGIASGFQTTDNSEGCSGVIKESMFVPIAKHLDWILETIQNN